MTKLTISDKRGVTIHEGMIGLFFEDINYAADGGLYAEMIENRSFEFFDCYGDKGDYYVKQDCGYGWRPADGADCVSSKMEYVMGSPVNRNNPHYLRFTAKLPGQGFCNKAYDGIFLEKGKAYRISFYARAASYQGDIRIAIRKDGQLLAGTSVTCISMPKESGQEWHRYETIMKAQETVKGGEFVIFLDKAGIVEFDFISMMPEDAVAGIFRKDLFELLKALKPGFLRFPGGCIVEGNTLENRYRWKESVGKPEERKANYSRWALHGTNQENGWHTQYSHYNQTLGLGFYEYFLLCEMIGAKPLPVLNVGLACQYQSYELVRTDTPEFQEFVQDALDLIEFANGSSDTPWGALRTQLGHKEPFGLDMLGIGNEQWQTERVDFYKRYELFEAAVHEKYPEIKLIGSAGPDVTSEHYLGAWDFYRKQGVKNPKFSFAVDEHYYVKPEWFYEYTDFYDEYPRTVKVFSGEYAAHPSNGMNNARANTLAGALAEAAFLTGVERNADVVILASYAPLFARLGYAQWSPDMIWFDGEKAYKTPSYYVQKLYSENMGTVTVPMEGQEKELRKENLFVNVTKDERTGEYIVKAVNAGKEKKALHLYRESGGPVCGTAEVWVLTGTGQDAGDENLPEKVSLKTENRELSGELVLQPESFCVVRILI